MKRTLLASAVLLAVFSNVNAQGVIFTDPDGFTVQIGDVTVDGDSVTLESTGSGFVAFGKVGADVVISNNDANGRGMSFNTGSATVLGKTISISGEKRAIHVSNNATTVSIGDKDTETVNIIQTVAGGDYVALASLLPGSVVDVTAKTVNIEAVGLSAVHVQNNEENSSTPETRAKINISAENINVTNKTSIGLAAYSGGELNVNGNLIVNAPRAIETRGNSVININVDGKHTTVLNGDIAFSTPGPDANSGSILNSTLNLHLSGEGSSWIGNLIQEYPLDFHDRYPNNIDDIIKVTGASVTLSNGAQWTPTYVETKEDSMTNGGVTWTQSSQYQAMNDLTLDGGVVNITGDNIDVIVQNMTGSGTINLAVDGDKAGKFTVEGATNASLDVNLMDAKMENELSSDDINAEQAKTLLRNVGGQGVETKTEVKEGLVNNGFGVNSKGETTTNSANTLMQSSLEMASAAPLALNRIMMNDVRKRLGDIRTSNGTHGAWARYDGGKLSGEGGLENDFHTIQVGIDTVPTADAPRMGVAFSYTDSDTEYARGSADMKAYSLAMYSTWMGDNGQFFDLIGRMGTADTDMVVDGQHKGSMDNVALSMSGEFGWRFDVTNSIYVEPQVEATYTYVNEDSLSLSTANYDVDAVHSLLGRIGFAAGMKCPSDYGNVYVRASAVHEFLGDSKITGVNAGNTNVYEIDGKDTWFEYGIGANFNLTKSTYMWADVERTTGGALDEDWRATVGVRYAW